MVVARCFQWWWSLVVFVDGGHSHFSMIVPGDSDWLWLWTDSGRWVFLIVEVDGGFC